MFQLNRGEFTRSQNTSSTNQIETAFFSIFSCIVMLTLSSCKMSYIRSNDDSDLRSQTTSFTNQWATISINSSSYSVGTNIDFAGSLNSCELTPASQADNSNAPVGFAGGSFSGVAFNTLSDGTSTGLKLASDGTCNGSTTNCNELNSTWTPQWSSIVGVWHFNEITTGSAPGGTDFADSSGKNSNATLTTATKLDLGVIGQMSKGIHVNSTSPVITLPAGTFPTGAAARSFSMWIKADTAVNQSFFAYGVQGGRFLFEILSISGNLFFHCYGGTCDTTSIAPTIPVTVGVWQHLAVTYDGSIIRLYSNGKYIGQKTMALNTGATMGILGYGYYSNQNNAIDELAAWNVQLSDSDIATIYGYQASNAKYNGMFTSRVMDALSSQSWTSLSWIPTLPFFKALPDYAGGAIQNETTTSYSSLQGDTPAVGDNNLMTGLAGLWHLDETVGTTAAGSVKDNSGNNNNGTPTNVTFGASGKLGTAGVFDGSSSYVDFGTSNLIKPTAAISIAHWVYFNSVSSGIRYLSDWHQSTSTDRWLFFFSSTGTLNFTACNVGETQAPQVTVSSITAGSWYFVVGTYDGSFLRLYLNGTLVAAPVALTGAMNGNTGASVRMGKQSETGGFFNGALDEVAIWSKALNATEVQQLYQRGASRIKFQARTCSDTTCTAGAPIWKGPDGTANTYFSELDNMSTQAATPSGTVNTTLPNITLQNYTTPVATNRYFQYRAIFESDSSTTTLMPELKSVTVGPNHYDTSAPTVMSKTGVSYYSLSNALQTLGTNGCSSGGATPGVLYNLGVGAAYSSATWYWWNGSIWTTAGATTTTANSATTIASNLSTFATQVGTGTVYFKAFLQSSGLSACELKNLELDGLQ